MFRRNCMILFVIPICLIISACQERDSQKIFNHSLRRAEKVIVYEGLPHQLYEEEQLQQELKAKRLSNYTNILSIKIRLH